MPFIRDRFLSLTANSLQELINSGAFEVDSYDENDEGSALTIAAAYQKVDLVRVLLSNGANKELIDSDGRTALMYAKRGGNTDLIELLSQSEPQSVSDENLFIQGVTEGDLDKIREIFLSVEHRTELIKLQSVRLLHLIQNATAIDAQRKWIPVADYLYEVSSTYRLVLKNRHLYALYDGRTETGFGFLKPFFDNQNTAGLEMLLRHGFPTTSPQYFYKNYTFNALQAAILLYIPGYLPCIKVLLEQSETATQFSSPSSVKSEHLIKERSTDSTQALVVSKADNFVALRMTEATPERDDFFRGMTKIDNALNFALISTTYHAPDLLAQLAQHSPLWQLFSTTSTLLTHKPIDTRLILVDCALSLRPRVYQAQDEMRQATQQAVLQATLEGKTNPLLLKTYMLFYIDNNEYLSENNKLAETATTLLLNAHSRFEQLSKTQKNQLLIELNSLSRSPAYLSQYHLILSTSLAAQLVYSMMDEHNYTQHQCMLELIGLRVLTLLQLDHKDTAALEAKVALKFISRLTESGILSADEIASLKDTQAYQFVIKKYGNPSPQQSGISIFRSSAGSDKKQPGVSNYPSSSRDAFSLG